MPTCMTCKRWKRVTERKLAMAHVDREDRPDMLMWGECEKFSRDKRRIISWVDCKGELMQTHQEFGCNQHEAK